MTFELLRADYNVAPTSTQPIIRKSKDTGERELVTRRWGLVPFFHEAALRRELLHSKTLSWEFTNQIQSTLTSVVSKELSSPITTPPQRVFFFCCISRVADLIFLELLWPTISPGASHVDALSATCEWEACAPQALTGQTH